MSLIPLRAKDMPDSDIPPFHTEFDEVPWAGQVNTDTAQYWTSAEDGDTTRVWLTPSGRWVKTQPGWDCYITPDQARAWLVANEHADAVREHLDREHDGRGRPEIGPEVKMRLPESAIAEVDRRAAANGVSRAAELRAIVMDAVYVDGDALGQDVELVADRRP